MENEMVKSEIDLWFKENQSKFLKEDYKKLKENKQNIDREGFKNLMDYSNLNRVFLKDPVFGTILSIFGGFFGLDRFYMHSFLIGLVKFITGGGFIILYLYDISQVCLAF